MKWLLVTTNPTPFASGSYHPNGDGWNVGDLFALRGTEELVREVDPRAEIELLNMDDASSFVPERPFDRAIFAGRPMFWREAERHPLWVHLLDGWLCRDPRKVMALGVGDCFPISDGSRELERQIDGARHRMWKLVLRSERSSAFFDALPSGVELSVCPAAWVLAKRGEEPIERLCNLMIDGGHYPGFEPFESSSWALRRVAIADALRRANFRFVAHTLREANLALELGWRTSEILIRSTVADYLSIYARAGNYVGNRMHGAIVLASRFATATAIGFDSRLFAVVNAGVGVTLPSFVTPDAIELIAGIKPGPREVFRQVRIGLERKRMLDLVADFAS